MLDESDNKQIGELYGYLIREGSASKTVYEVSGIENISMGYLSDLDSFGEWKPDILKYCLKSLLNSRYVSTLTKDSISEQICDKSFKECFKYEYLIEKKQRIFYHILYAFPLLYRCFRILNDKTMLSYEKEIKEYLKQHQGE